MMHEFCPSSNVSIVLGDLPENYRETRYKIISKIKKLISTGNIILEKESGIFFLKRWEYDFVQKSYIRGPEYAELIISTKNGKTSIEIEDEWRLVSLKTLFEAVALEAGK